MRRNFARTPLAAGWHAHDPASFAMIASLWNSISDNTDRHLGNESIRHEVRRRICSAVDIIDVDLYLNHIKPFLSHYEY